MEQHSGTFTKDQNLIISSNSLYTSIHVVEIKSPENNRIARKKKKKKKRGKGKK